LDASRSQRSSGRLLFKNILRIRCGSQAGFPLKQIDHICAGAKKQTRRAPQLVVNNQWSRRQTADNAARRSRN
jgi:hypothetical protein